MKTIENQLSKYNKDWLTSTLLSVGDAVITTDQQGVISFANQSALRVLQMFSSDVLHKPFHEIFKVYTEQSNDTFVFFEIDSKSSFCERGLPKTAYYITPNQDKIYLSAKTSVLESAKEGFLGFVTVFRDITQIIETEKKMEREKNSLEIMFELLPSGMIIFDKEMRAKKVNPAFLKIFGQVESRVIGRLFGEVIRCVRTLDGACGSTKSCGLCQFRKLMSRLQDTGRVIKDQVVEATLFESGIKKNKWLNLSVMPITLNDEWLFLLTVDDITERINHEKELEMVKLNTLTLLDHLPVMICRYNKEKNITFINGTLKRYLCEPTDLIDVQTLLESRMAPKDSDLMHQNLIKCFQKRKKIQFETFMTDSKGEKRSMLSVVAPIFERTDLEGAIMVFLDVHEAKKVQSLYLESQKKYKLLFEHLDSSVAYLNVIRNDSGEIVDAKVKEINPVTERLFGGLATHWKGTKLSEATSFPEPLKKRLLLRFKQVLQKGETIHLNDYYFEPLGKWIDVSIYTPEKDDVVILATDIDEKKRGEIALLEAKERSEEANRSKSDFLANMSHEIRTPLNGIVGMIDLTMLEALSEEQKENLITAKDCVRTLIDIINDVLDFSKIEAGKLSVSSQVFDVKRLIDSTVKTHTAHAEEKGLAVKVHYLTPVSDFLSGDGKRIKQVFNNLMSNAIKFTEEGSISIQVIETGKEEKLDRTLHISVQDTGIGIPEKKHSALFKSFTQIDGSYTRQYGGTGLGLVISKQLIELMGGKITFKSIVNKGSVFQFSVPLKIADSPLEIIEESPVLIKVFDGFRILLVEDDRVNQIVMTKMLEKMKVSVSYAENGYEAVKICETETFDLILMDIQMPVMDGISATRNIRKKNIKVPIVALTAYALEGDEAIFMSSGMNGYLSKPVQSATLVKMIERFKVSEEDLIVQRIKAFNMPPKLELDDVSVSESVRNLNELEQWLLEGNVVLLEKLAHTIKNGFELMGAEELKRLAFKMELEIRKERFESVLELVHQIRAILLPFEKGEESL